MRSRSAGSAAGGRRPGGAMEGLPEELVLLVCVCVCVRARAPARARAGPADGARAAPVFESVGQSATDGGCAARTLPPGPGAGAFEGRAGDTELEKLQKWLHFYSRNAVAQLDRCRLDQGRNC